MDDYDFEATVGFIIFAALIACGFFFGHYVGKGNAEKELPWHVITEATNYCMDKDTGLVAITIDTQVKAHCLDGSVLTIGEGK